MTDRRATSRSRARRRSSTASSPAGRTRASISPGRGPTPLAFALARDPRIDVHVHLDERSSAFFALGMAKATGKPASRGVHERHGRRRAPARRRRGLAGPGAADRPDGGPAAAGPGDRREPDDRATGLFGEVRPRASLDLPVPTAVGQDAWWRQAAREALEAMAADPIGPVHLNCPFEEPLTPSPERRPVRNRRTEVRSGNAPPRSSTRPRSSDSWSSSPERGARSSSVGFPPYLSDAAHVLVDADGVAGARGADVERPDPGRGARGRPVDHREPVGSRIIVPRS